MKLKPKESGLSDSQMSGLNSTSTRLRVRCKSMSDDVHSSGSMSHLQAVIADIGSSPSTIIGQELIEGRYYSFGTLPSSACVNTLISTEEEPGSEVITGLKGFVDPLNPSPDDETLKSGINSLIQLYRSPVTYNSDELRDFVNFYCEKVIITVVTPPVSPGCTSRTTGSIVQVDSFSCPVCYGIFIDPVTVRCGHSYCRKCLHKEKAGKTCRRCKHILGTKDVGQTKVNVLIQFIVEKWWPNYVSAKNLRNEGNEMFEENRGEEALDKYSQAINICQDDHLSLGNRSQILLTLGRSEEALIDAEAAIKSCPVWVKGYFRKAVTLGSLGRYEDAFTTLTVCLYLVKATKVNDDTAVVPLKCELMKVLHKIFLQSTGGSSSAVGIRRATTTSRSPGSLIRRDRTISRPTHLGTNIRPIADGTRTPFRPIRRRLIQRNRGSVSIPEQNVQRTHRLFSRAVQETKRIQREVIERTKTVSDQPRCPKSIEWLPYRRSPALRTVDRSLISANDFECTLCYRLLYQPITTTCGHTFCRSCMARSLDHSSSCPLCKTILEEEGWIGQYSYATYFIEMAMEEFLPDELEERIRQHQEELETASSSGRGLEIPIFVCTVGFPTVPCPLHAFEPRYRLMIRRAMESGTRRFGMCSYSQEGVQESHDRVYNEASDWLTSISQILRQRISTHFGQMPPPEENWLDLSDGPAWAWWLLAILPLDTKAQLAILTMNKLEGRLHSILNVLTYVKSNKL